MKKLVFSYFLFLIPHFLFPQNVGINIANPTEKLHVGEGRVRIEGPSTPGGMALSIGKYGEIRVDSFGTEGGRFIIKENGNVGIKNAEPAFPLNFGGQLGDKISLWGNEEAHYGLGVQSLLLQIHTDISAADIAFGHGSSASLTETMRIKGNGNVGIGITSPTTKLDVAGGIRASAYQFSNPKTYYYSIPGVAFHPFVTTDQLYKSTYGVTFWITAPSAISSRIYAPVNLPNGAAIQEIKANYSDFSTVANFNIFFAGTSPSVQYYYATITSSGTPGESSGTAVLGGLVVIDNQQFSYLIEVSPQGGVSWPVGGAFNLFSIHSIIITYTLPGL